jgi:class 3 adenylate cyclase
VPQVAAITQWLASLGMSEYGRRFTENDIDVSVLRHLTDQDLKELGVSLGHRRKMLAAIAELAGAAPGSQPAVAPEPKPRDHAERRQLTVMFTDLVGSTPLSTKLDPEDLRSVIGAYHKCVAETVARFDGLVAKFMGDGVLVYFGYPQAHEDDAERAVRAGLALVGAVGQVQSPEHLQVRVGIATGLVVVGDLVGTGAAQEQAVVGETPNLAARLQAIAKPDSVIIAAGTRRLTGGLFEYEDLGTVEAKGFAQPVRAWRVRGESTIDSRYEALRSGETPLIGREEEIELLRRRWQRAKSGGEVVLLSGEPGIGKSRLTAALLEEIASETHTRLRYFCSPHHTDSAFHPIISQLGRAAGFERDDNSSIRLGKLDVLLSPAATSAEDRRLIADLLSLPGAELFPALDLTPQQRKQRTLEALVRQLESLVAEPAVLQAAAAIGPTLEGKTQRQKNPHPPGSLPWLSWIVARLGGWNCYYKPPGPNTMRAGWDKLAAMTAGFHIAISVRH